MRNQQQQAYARLVPHKRKKNIVKQLQEIPSMFKHDYLIMMQYVTESKKSKWRRFYASSY